MRAALLDGGAFSRLVNIHSPGVPDWRYRALGIALVDAGRDAAAVVVGAARAAALGASQRALLRREPEVARGGGRYGDPLASSEGARAFIGYLRTRSRRATWPPSCARSRSAARRASRSWCRSCCSIRGRIRWCRRRWASACMRSCPTRRWCGSSRLALRARRHARGRRARARARSCDAQRSRARTHRRIMSVTRVEIPDGWQQGRGAFGGLVLSTLLRAIEEAESDGARVTRTLTGDCAARSCPAPPSRGAHAPPRQQPVELRGDARRNRAPCSPRRRRCCRRRACRRPPMRRASRLPRRRLRRRGASCRCSPSARRSGRCSRSTTSTARR